MQQKLDSVLQQIIYKLKLGRWRISTFRLCIGQYQTEDYFTKSEGFKWTMLNWKGLLL